MTAFLTLFSSRLALAQAQDLSNTNSEASANEEINANDENEAQGSPENSRNLIAQEQITEYDRALYEGRTHATANDYGNALAAFGRAREARSDGIEAILMTGLVLNMQGNYDEALVYFAQGELVTRNSDNHSMRAKILFGKARAVTFLNPMTEDALNSWNEVLSFVESHPEVLSPQLVQLQIRELKSLQELHQSYNGVRERIAEREAENSQDSEN